MAPGTDVNDLLPDTALTGPNGITSAPAVLKEPMLKVVLPCLRRSSPPWWPKCGCGRPAAMVQVVKAGFPRFGLSIHRSVERACYIFATTPLSCNSPFWTILGSFLRMAWNGEKEDKLSLLSSRT